MQNKKQIEKDILNYLQSLAPEFPIQLETELINTGILDSLGALELHGYIEKKFKVLIPSKEINHRNFFTPQAIVDLIVVFSKKKCSHDY